MLQRRLVPMPVAHSLALDLKLEEESLVGTGLSSVCFAAGESVT
jgi:hypothetical protein